MTRQCLGRKPFAAGRRKKSRQKRGGEKIEGHKEESSKCGEGEKIHYQGRGTAER